MIVISYILLQKIKISVVLRASGFRYSLFLENSQFDPMHQCGEIWAQSSFNFEPDCGNYPTSLVGHRLTKYSIRKNT